MQPNDYEETYGEEIARREAEDVRAAYAELGLEHD